MKKLLSILIIVLFWQTYSFAQVKNYTVEATQNLIADIKFTWGGIEMKRDSIAYCQMAGDSIRFQHVHGAWSGWVKNINTGLFKLKTDSIANSGYFTNYKGSLKVDKVSGKALSDNNFTDADSTKLVVLQDSLNGRVKKITGQGLIRPSLRDSIAGAYQDLSGLVPKTTTITATAPLTIAGTTSADLSANRTLAIVAASTSVPGSMSAADKTKLDGIASGATANVGTVTSVATGLGLSGGTITGSGTLLVDTASASILSRQRAVNMYLGKYSTAANSSLLESHNAAYFQVAGSFVPYTGATGAVDLGAYDLTVNGLTVGKGGNSITGNTAVGTSSLASITSGDMNTAIGYQTMISMTDGSLNTALGWNALHLNNGTYNVAIGINSLYNLTTGSNNIAIGDQSGSEIGGFGVPNETSNNSIYLGNGAKAKIDGGDNEIVIGSGIIGNGSNTATWGNTSITDHYFNGIIHATGGTFTGAVTGNNVASTSTVSLYTGGTYGSPTNPKQLNLDFMQGTGSGPVIGARISSLDEQYVHDGANLYFYTSVNSGTLRLGMLLDRYKNLYTYGSIITTGAITAPNFISNVATGTQPYATTSTTLNTNLNADMIDGLHLASGTYTPTFTETENISSSTPSLSSYSRVGNIVTVSISGLIYPSASGFAVLEISFPISGSNTYPCSGTVSLHDTGYYSGQVNAFSNSSCKIAFNAPSTDALAFTATFQYSL